ncbi:MAG: GWxTD domain-containing protein [Gemmatimonadota bacterium]
MWFYRKIGGHVNRRFGLSVVAGLSIIGCGNWQREGTNPAAPKGGAITEVLDMGAVYKRLGRLVAPGPVSFIGDIVYAAGPGDSTIAVVGLSLENRALSFQREDGRFVARYHVEIVFQPEGAPAIRVNRDEVVQVATFQETMRNDESVLFQQFFHLLPAIYKVSLALRDRSSSEQSRVDASVTVPALTAGMTSAPIVSYEVTGRARQQDPLAVVLNPRGTVAYGSDTLLAYVEGYNFPGPVALPFQIHDSRDSIVFEDSLRFVGGQDVEGQVIRLTPDSAPLGQLRLVVGTGAGQRETSAIVSLSTAWVVTNFDEMTTLLRYFGYKSMLDSLRNASPNDRPQLWKNFYTSTDPNHSTPENEALDLYFGRLAAANNLFRDEGVQGWRTDRGEVFIGLGDPDEVYDSSPLSQGRVIRWVYTQDRLVITFLDETGFGRFRLATSSRADFERVLDRHRRQGR